MAYSSIQDPTRGYSAAVDKFQRLRTSTCHPAVPNVSTTTLPAATATTIANANEERINIEIRNNANYAIFILPGTGVSASDFPLGPGQRFTLPIGVCYTGPFEAIDPAGGATVSVIDWSAS